MRAPADGEHLLFPSAQGSGKLVSPLFENRKKLINFSQGFALPSPRLRCVRADLQVFQDGQTGEDPPALRNHGNPLDHCLIGREAVYLIPPELHRSTGRFFHPRNGVEQGRLSGSVGADD